MEVVKLAPKGNNIINSSSCKTILLCKPDASPLTQAEASWRKVPVEKNSDGWVLCAQSTVTGLDWCFPRLVMNDAVWVTGESVNALAQNISQYFLESSRDEQFKTSWSFIISGATPEYAKRANAVRRQCMELCSRRMARVMKLAVDNMRIPGEMRGMFALLTAKGEGWVSRNAWFGGQNRMRDDNLAPSRSYLKIEEAMAAMGVEPGLGNTVVDLGAAPGGWSYAAAKRGARVTAVDNGPLKAGAFANPLIKHLKADGFSFGPDSASSHYDWLLCDMVEDLLIRHLYHDRD